MSKCDVGIDLGTTNIKIFIKNKGIVLKTPSVVAIKRNTGKLFEIGKKAYEMIGKTPDSIIVKHPVSTGVIVDYELNKIMLDELLSRVLNKSIKKARVCMCIHGLMTNVEIKALTETILSSGCEKVFLIDESVASGLGAGIDLCSSNGEIVVNIGGGTTDVALISLNGIVVNKSIRYGGQNIDSIILKNIANNNNLLIGVNSAERTKINFATVNLPKYSKKCILKGKDMITGLPKSITVTQCDIYNHLKAPVQKIVDSINDVIEQAPPEALCDIQESGILLTGGGSLMEGLPEFIAKKTGIKTRLADHPTDCVIYGVGKSFDMIDNFNLDFVKMIT